MLLTPTWQGGSSGFIAQMVRTLNRYCTICRSTHCGWNFFFLSNFVLLLPFHHISFRTSSQRSVQSINIGLYVIALRYIFFVFRVSLRSPPMQSSWSGSRRSLNSTSCSSSGSLTKFRSRSPLLSHREKQNATKKVCKVSNMSKLYKH
mgnify:CR=1 FL=1